MVELEAIDLAKTLDMLSKRLAQLARDIPLELDDPRFALEMANALEQTAPLLREHAAAKLPAVIETPHFSEEQMMTGHPVEHSDEDAEVRRLQAEASEKARQARTQQDEPDDGK